MKFLFAHSSKMLCYENLHYTTNLSANIWQTRYLPYCDSLTVMCREIPVSEKPVGKMIADCPNVSFSGIRANNLYVAYFKKHKQILEAIRQNVLECDLAIVRVPYLFSWIVLQMCKKYNKPCLVEVVGCAWDVFRTHSKRGALLAPVTTLIMRKTVRNADFAIYVTKSFLQKRYPCKGKTLVCSDAKIELPTEALLNARLKRCEAFVQKKPIALATVGAVNVAYKGQEYVLRAIARLKQEGFVFRYQIIGGGDPRRLQQIVKELGIDDMVEFTGNLTHEQVFAALDETDIYVHPSLTEGLPRSVLEAESRGCAVIGTNVGGMPEIVPPENLFGKKGVDGIVRLLRGYSAEKLAQEAKRNMAFAAAFAEKNSEEVRAAFMKKVCAAVRERG